jgi:hypothetical protein
VYRVYFRHEFQKRQACTLIFCEQILGQVGKVLSNNNDYHLRVLVGSHEWTLSPGICTVETASGEPEAEIIPGETDSDSSSDESSDDTANGRNVTHVIVISVS